MKILDTNLWVFGTLRTNEQAAELLAEIDRGETTSGVTGPGQSRSVGEATLRYLNRVFGHRPEGHHTSLFPINKLETLAVTLDITYFPEHIERVSLESRAYTNADFGVSSHEIRAGDRRQGRWDRHD